MKQTNKKITAIIFGLMVMVMVLITLGVSWWMNSRGSAPVTPAAPESRPQAAGADQCVVGFNVSKAVCNQYCVDDSSCDQGLFCDSNSDTCRHPDYPDSAECLPSEDEEDELVCNDLCSTDTQCQLIDPDYVCYDLGDETRCRLDENPESNTCELDSQELTELSCNSLCETDQQCLEVNQNYVCHDLGEVSRCRLAENTSSSTCKLDYQCNSPCTTDAECKQISNDYICYSQSNTCRLSGNPSSSTCQPLGGPQPTPTPTPTPTLTPAVLPTPAPTPNPTPTNTPSNNQSVANPTPSPTPVETPSELPQSGSLEVATLLTFVGVIVIAAGIGLLLVL